MAADPGCGSAVVAEPGWGSAVVAEPGWGSAVSALAGTTPASEEDAPVCRRLRVAMSNALHIPTTFPLAFFVVLLLWVLVFFLTSSRKRVRPLWPGEAMMPSGACGSSLSVPVLPLPGTVPYGMRREEEVEHYKHMSLVYD